MLVATVTSITIQGTHEAIQGIGGLSIRVVILQRVLIEALSPLILLISLK
jgi:hypothetical protein